MDGSLVYVYSVCVSTSVNSLKKRNEGVSRVFSNDGHDDLVSRDLEKTKKHDGLGT